MLLDLSFLGWVHTVACVVALVLGAINLMRVKGTPLHRRIGQAYFCTILLVCVTSLGIYRLKHFFFPHYLAIVTMILAVVAFAFARCRWPARLWFRGHLVCTY